MEQPQLFDTGEETEKPAVFNPDDPHHLAAIAQTSLRRVAAEPRVPNPIEADIGYPNR